MTTENKLTYSEFICNMVVAKWQYLNGGAAIHEINYKVHDWTDDRGRHRFQAYIKFPGITKPVRKNFQGQHGEAEAWRFVLDLFDRYMNKEPLDSLVKPVITFMEWVEKFKTVYMSELNQNSQNLAVVKCRINKLNEFFKDYKIKDITSWTIRQYRDQRQKEVNAKSINNEVMLLQSILNGAVDEGYIEENPCKEIKKLHAVKIIHREPIRNIKEVLKAVWHNEELRTFNFFSSCRSVYYLFKKKLFERKKRRKIS